MHVAIRADGSPEIGYGHLVRTGVLARTFLDHGHRVTYLTRTPSTVREVCPNETDTYQLGETDDILTWLDANEPEILLVDSYGVGTEYQRRLSGAVPTLAMVTDDTRFTLCCDVNINGNVHAPELDYDWEGEKPEMLLGTEYLLMREAFQQLATRTPPWHDPPDRVLVTFGGSDMNNGTPDAVRAFDGVDLDVAVIIGPGFTNEAEIDEAVRGTDAEFTLTRDPDDLPQRMFTADFAVSATGSTVYELLLTGTPVIGIPQTANQLPIAETLSSRDAIVSIETDERASFDDGVYASSDPQLLDIDSNEMIKQLRMSISMMIADSDFRRELREKGMELVDGNGSARVYNEIQQITSHD